MRLLTRRTIENFGEAHSDAEQALSEWCFVVEAGRWMKADDMQRQFGKSARAIGNNRVIFNIKGNHYRVVAEIRYSDGSPERNGIVRVMFVGTHAEYDSIDAQTVDQH